MGAKITKAARRERNSGSADAKAAYLPLSKPFVIPRKKAKQGLFQEVSLQSREFLKDILPIITKQYRSKDAENRFTFTKAQLIHNEELTRTFHERRKEMKDEGRTEKELMESYAFIATDNNKAAEKMCQDGVSATGGHVAPLGNPKMGVYLSRYADIIKREGLESGHQGILIILKILKGRVKAMPLNYTSVLEPIPNYDSHVAKSSALDMTKLSSLQTPMAFDATQIYLYEFGELDMVKRPRQVCPYAVVSYTYQEPVKASPATVPLSQPLLQQETRDSVVQGTSSANHHHAQSMPPLAPLASTPAKPDIPRLDPTKKVTTDKPTTTPSLSQIENLRKNHFLVWKGMLCAKSEPLCSACMISFTSPVLPQILPAVINFKTKISFAKMHAYFPSGIFASGIPLTSNIREVCRRNKYVVYCELQHNQESTQRYQQLLQFMLLNQAVLKCRLEGNVTMFVFPTSTLSHDLGVTRGDYPETLHVLFTARSPMIGHIAEKGIYIPSGTKVQTPIADNQLLEGSDNKQLMLRIGLLSMFTRQSHDLKHQTDIRSPEASSIHSPAQGGSDALTPLSVDRTSTVAVKSKVIDYQHGLLSKKDLLSTYRSQKMQVTDNQGSNHPFQPGFVNRSPLPSEVPNVHPMYSSPASTLNIQADPVPEGSLHPMYNISETLAAPASSDGVSKKQPHPVYNPQGHPQSPSIMEAVHEENVHPMYSQHLEPSRGDQKSSSTDLLARDTWLGPTSSGSPGTAAVGVQREPPQVSRQSSKLPLGSILDQQAEITRLQEEMRILRRHKEISAGGPALEECYNAKLTKLQDFLQALRQERSRLNQEEDGRVQMEGLEDTRREQHSGDRPVGEDEVTEKLDVFSSPEVKAVESCAPQSSPLLTDTSKDLPGSSVSPALSTKVMEVVQQIAKLPVKPTQNNPEVSVQTLKAVIEKVLISPSTENTTGEGIAKSGPTFPVSIPLSMLSSGKPSDDAPGLVGHQSALKPGQGEADESGEVSQNDESGGGSRLSEKGQVKPPSNPFGDALASMDHYSLSGRASKKLKRSHSKEFGEKSEQDSKLGTEEKPITEERCNKESLSLDLNLARKVIPNFDPQADGLSSPIRGASEMKAFLNGGVVHTKDRITSATDMKSYLNKKLLDSEHEKTDRTRKGGGGSASLKRGKLSKERTIEEIDNEIRRLNKEKERLKSQFARKRNSSGGSISDKPKKLPFINSVDLKGLGRIPKKKMPSPERVEGASAFSNQTKLSAERTVDNQGGLSIGSAKGSSQDSLEGTVSLSTGIAGLTEGVTGIPDCPSDKSSYQVCSKEMQLSGGKEKGLFATGQDGSGRTLYMVVLTRKFLEGGLKEEEWSGTSLQHCISDTLHRGARFDNTKETEEERFFSQNAAAAIRKVFAKQTAEDQTIRQVTEDYQQTVTFNSDGESKSSQKPEGFSDAKEDSSPTLGQNVVDPNTETSNTEDKELVAPEETVIVVSNGENSRDEPASPIKEPSVVSHKTEDSQEGQKALSGSPSTDLTEPVRTTDLDSNVKLEDTKEQNSTGKPGIRDGLVINDGACFFGDLESEEGVCVNFDLEEDSVTARGEASQPSSVAASPTCQTETSSIGAASTTGSRVSLPTSCSDNNTFSGSSNNSSKCFSIASRCSFDNSSSFGNNDRFSYNSNGSSSDNSTCSSNTNINSSVSSSSKLAGAGGGSSNNQLTEKGGIKPQLITSTANQDISLQSLKPEQVKMAHENRTRSPSNLLQVVNQQLNPVKTHPVTSKKESCLLSCSINAARDPRIRRLHNQPTPPSSSQAGPQKTSLQTAVSSSPAESTPLAQKEALETAPCATQNSSSAPVTSRKPPSLSNRPAKSILKGGQNPTSFVTVDSENRPSSPPCEQTLSGSSDASRKVKISLSQYKGKADPRSKVPPDKVEIGREEGQPKSSCTGMCKVEPSADIKQIVFLPPHQNIKITLSGDSVRSILLPEKQNRKDKPDSEDLDAVGMNMNGADEQEPGRTSTDHALPSGKPALKLQNGNKKDLRMVVDQSSPQSSAPSSEANNLLATQPNLVITIPRDGSGESTPSDMTETGVVPNDRQLTDDTATTTVTTFPESREVSLETSITLTQLELEDSIFNLTADAVGNTTAEETHKREHLNKLSPNSISRRLQSIKYELEAFWSELRKLDMPDELQVDEALPTDPRRCNLHNSRKLTQNGEFGENDLTAWAANDILADITSELSACLNSTRVLKEEQSQVSECLSKHLPKFSKLRGMAMSPRMNGSSPQESSNKLSSINEFISGLREEFCRRVEDICFSAADYSSPEKVVEVRAESESSVHSLDKDLVKKIQQMLTAARAQASLVQENSKEPEGTVKIEKASENTATLELKTNYSLNTNLSLLSSKEKVTKEVEMAEVGVESSSSPLKEKPEKSMETEKGKEVQVKGKSRSSVPERKSASSSPQASPDSCKWGKFKMKLWGKRPTKQRKIMKATWIKVEKPKPSSEVSTELSTKAECDTTSDDTKDPVVKEDDRDGDTEECKERKLSVSEEQAVEEMCAKLLGDEKALSEEKLAVTGTIPTLLNRTTSHASSVAKRSSSGPASLKTAAGFSRPQGQVKQGVVLQPGQYQPPYNPQGHVNPVKAQSQQSQAVHATGQYSLNGASCQGYFQQHPSHPNLQLPGYVQQQVPSNFLSSCQQNPNSIQQQYANYGYGSGSAQGMTSVRPPIVSSEMRHWHSGVGPLQTNTGVGPANMGPRPTSMGPEHSNMGLGPNNLAPGPKNTGLGPNNMGPGPNSMGPGPNNMGLCVNNIGTGPASIGQRPTNMTPGPNNMGSGPNNIGPGSNNMGQGITNSIGQGSTNVGPGPGSIIPGPRNMGSGPINRMPGPTNTVPGPSSIVPGPSNMGSSPINRMPGPTNMGPGHHFFGPGAYNSGPNNFGYGSNYMSPGPNSMGPGANNIGAGPNSVGPSPSRGPGPNNLAPGTYNIGPGAYNMDSVPCNAGPRLNQPVRQQPPVPGLDCEGVNTGLAVCEDLVDNTYHGKSSEAHVGQCDSELTDHSESRDTLVVVKQVSFQEPEENAHVPVSEALVPVPSPFLRPRVLEATDKCCARSLETSVEPVEGKVVGSKTSPEGSMEICIFEAAVPQFSETCIIEDAKVSASLKLTKMLDVKEVSPKVAEEDKGGQLNSYIVSRLEQQDVRAPSEMSGTMIDNLDESSTLLDSRRKSSSTEKQTESDKSPRESESFFLALLEVVQWRVFLTSRNKTRQQM
ncbi:uncharacterized protein LOC110982150 isoform X7 [Acanthaster planci]|uniref:Uncharacterized protein LOC110982150 isoform X7 n=1 Tax=Acanthaster planci TaxID=133434 RepID=A0A8B7YTP8_ACAPL|nr:uncharacterized protein LOC110982150 isoform X7 [Acanthaster planci]